MTNDPNITETPAQEPDISEQVAAIFATETPSAPPAEPAKAQEPAKPSFLDNIRKKTQEFVAAVKGAPEGEPASAAPAATPAAPAAPAPEEKAAPARTPSALGKVLEDMKAGESPALDDLAGAFEEMVNKLEESAKRTQELEAQLNEKTGKVEKRLSQVDQAAQRKLADQITATASSVAETLSGEFGEPISWEDVLTTYRDNFHEVAKRFPGKEMSQEALRFAFDLEAFAAGVELPTKAPKTAPAMSKTAVEPDNVDKSAADRIAEIFNLK